MPESSKTPSKEPVSRDTLTELIRTGARQLLAHALEAERAELLAQYADQQDEQGRAMVVGSGHHPEREIQTGLGPVSVQVP
ncbi:MAG: IS256 family transposase, partial [Nitrospira sp.]|nr:IS256 family transposase [Nitrospira sp.]